VIDVYFQTPFGTCCFGGLRLELIDPATNGVLGTVSSVSPTPRLEDQGIGRVTLPASRRYLIRVTGVDDRYGSGVYRFRVVAP
jgi:hypothetical protein